MGCVEQDSSPGGYIKAGAGGAGTLQLCTAVGRQQSNQHQHQHQHEQTPGQQSPQPAQCPAPLTVPPQVLSLVVAVAVAGPLYSLRQLGLGHDLGLPAQPLPVVGPVASPGQLPHLVKR